MQISDWLTIAEIVVTAGVGIWIATGIQSNLTQSRGLKEYFIQELIGLQSVYRNLIDQIWSGKTNSKAVKDTLKVLSFRVTTLEKFMEQKFRNNKALIKEAHASFQQELTSLDDFNIQYESEFLSLTPQAKQELLPLQNKIIEALTQTVIYINEAKLH